jgi:SAM-dependent methyltransferase
MAETIKAKNRRIQEGFFEKYIKGSGIDIGCGRLGSNGADIIEPNAMPWDKDNGDATFLIGVENNSFDYVYSSHCLEHINNPYLALKNWFRILKPEGYLILYVPHRDLYEKKKDLPSNWNGDHKFFLLPEIEELPFTLNFKSLIIDSLEPYDYEIQYLKICDENYVSNGSKHSGGEYSIEAVIKKYSSYI